MKVKINKLNIFIAGIFMFVYIFSGFYFLYSNIESHNGMHHHTNQNCTYIMGQDILCSMNLFDFMDKWKDIYSIIIFYQNIMLISLVAIFVSLLFINFLRFHVQLLYFKRFFTIPILYEILFSRGILNSKAF